jgi:hypothetical protein
MNGYVNEAKVTPLMVTAGPFMSNAATSVPSVLTSLSPEMFVGVPQVITEPSAQAHAEEALSDSMNAAATLKQRTLLSIRIRPFLFRLWGGDSAGTRGKKSIPKSEAVSVRA